MTLPEQLSFQNEKRAAKEITERVIQLYQDNPAIGDSDRRLLYTYWLKFDRLDKVLSDNLESFRQWLMKDATPAETITRAGRKLRNQGQMESSPVVELGKRKKRRVLARYYSQGGE